MIVMLVLGKVILLYADPGAGALLLQMLMAVLFGGMFFFRRIKDKILGMFRKEPAAIAPLKSHDPQSAESTDVEGE